MNNSPFYFTLTTKHYHTQNKIRTKDKIKLQTDAVVSLTAFLVTMTVLSL